MAVFRTKYAWFVVLAVLLMMALFVGLSAVQGGAGFPLDDAWIHQTYARNFAENGRFEYAPGVVSAGSTSPLWTILLAVGYILRLPYLGWAFFLGGVTLLWLALASMRLWQLLWPPQSDKSWLPGLVIVLTWPLVWAAASGMETLFFAALGMQILVLFTWAVTEAEDGSTVSLKLAALTGFLSGLLILVRPDGLALLLLIALGYAFCAGSASARAGRVGVCLGTAVLPLLPYFYFNYQLSGALWPNTFYAKQAEYELLLAVPIWRRALSLLYYSVGGPPQGWRGISSAHLLLLPGIITAGVLAVQQDWRRRRLLLTVPLLWAGGHVVLYAWRLPVTYQHGRYLLAAMPVWILYGLAGWLWLGGRLGNGRYQRILKQAAVLTFALMLLFFALLGGQTYASDVAFIEGEMVDMAHWLAANTPPAALIATHDIGAIGYFGERPLLDMAGLISPEIIPSLTDEAALSQYLTQAQADYLVTAPGWPYQGIIETTHAQLLYQTNFAWTTEQGLNNMAIYDLKPD